MPFDQRAAYILPGSAEACAAVRAAHPRADYHCRQFRTHGRKVWQYVVTADGTANGRRLGPPRVTIGNAWVAAHARLTAAGGV